MTTDDTRPCTYRGCGKPEGDPVHPVIGERMARGRHVYRHEPSRAALAATPAAERARHAALVAAVDRMRRVLEYINDSGLLDADEWLWLDKEVRAALDGEPR